jgi:hypothetical protein
MSEMPSVNSVIDQASAMKPRLIDTWILPGAVMYLAWASGRKKPNRWLRRIVFTGGIYMVYRNLAEYRKAADEVVKIAAAPATAVPSVIDSILAQVDLPAVSTLGAI